MRKNELTKEMLDMIVKKCGIEDTKTQRGIVKHIFRQAHFREVIFTICPMKNA